MIKTAGRKQKVILSIILVMVFYIAITLYGDITKISENFLSLKFEYIPIILTISFSSFVVRGIRQKYFLDSIKIKLSIKENIQLYFAGMSMLATPGGAGVLIKAQILKDKYNISRSKTGPLVIFERYQDTIATIIILVGTIIFIQTIYSTLIVLIVSSILLITYFCIRKPSIFLKFQNMITKISFFKKRLPSNIIDDSIKELSKPKIMIYGSILGVLSFLLDAVVVYLGFLAFNVDLGFIENTQMYLSSLLIGAISFLPAGIGVMDASLIGLLLQKNVDIATATSIILFVRLSNLWFATVIGFISIKSISKVKQ